MFTGLIQAVGTVLERKETSTRASFKVETTLAAELKLGGSIAVNGVCLTAAHLDRKWFLADVMPETWRSTNLSYLKPGDAVNLEPALRLGDTLGGHLVSGHVEGVGEVQRIERQNNAVLIRVRFSKQLVPFIVYKGSIAVNGVSLTIQETSNDQFLISLIPHTFRETNFSELKVGDLVNLETDMMAKYLMKNEAVKETRITETFLADHGFL